MPFVLTRSGAVHFGMEGRLVHHEQTSTLQVFYNRVVMGPTATRRLHTRDPQITLQDLRSRLGIGTVRVAVGHRQLRWAGHLDRMPEHRLERQLLFGRLSPEYCCPQGQRGAVRPHLRQQLLDIFLLRSHGFLWVPAKSL